jgi:hypothetical protein
MPSRFANSPLHSLPLSAQRQVSQRYRGVFFNFGTERGCVEDQPQHPANPGTFPTGHTLRLTLAGTTALLPDASRQPEIFQHANCGGGFVERVKVQAGCARFQEFLALAGGVFNSKFRRRRIVVADGVQL